LNDVNTVSASAQTAPTGTIGHLVYATPARGHTSPRCTPLPLEELSG